jgi:hypothetical protein
MTRPFDTPPQEDPHAQLERAFMDEYLRSRQQSLESIQQLPPQEAAQLLSEASIFASARLTEVESRAHYVDDLHRAPNSVPPLSPPGSRTPSR